MDNKQVDKDPSADRSLACNCRNSTIGGGSWKCNYMPRDQRLGLLSIGAYAKRKDLAELPTIAAISAQARDTILTGDLKF